MSAVRFAQPIDAVRQGPTSAGVSVVTLPDRLNRSGEVRLVRLRLESDSSGDVVSIRLGPVKAARMLLALERAIAEAWPEPEPEPEPDEAAFRARQDEVPQ